MVENKIQSPEVVEKPKCKFIEKLENKWAENKFVCVGLDSDLSQIPEDFKSLFSGSCYQLNENAQEIIFEFNKKIIQTTADIVCAYKLNPSFYKKSGVEGEKALSRSISYLKFNYPDTPVILDEKYADVGHTSEAYAHYVFDNLQADACTVNPYLGKEPLEPLLKRQEKGIITVVKTSNPGSGEFQNLRFNKTREPFYQIVARRVSEEWNDNGNCLVQVGANYRKELSEVRGIVGDMPILIPAVGTQNAEVKSAVIAGSDSRGKGMIISSSRAIIFASGKKRFALAAREATLNLHNEINTYRHNYSKVES